MREIVLPAEVWSPLVSYTPPYILDRDGIIQHEPLAKLLRANCFDAARRIECEPWAAGLVFRQEEYKPGK